MLYFRVLCFSLVFFGVNLYGFSLKIDTNKVFQIQDSILESENIFIPDSLVKDFKIRLASKEDFDESNILPGVIPPRYSMNYDSTYTYLHLQTSYSIGVLRCLTLGCMLEIDIKNYKVNRAYFKKKDFLLLKGMRTKENIAYDLFSEENIFELITSLGEIKILSFDETTGDFQDSLTKKYNDTFVLSIEGLNNDSVILTNEFIMLPVLDKLNSTAILVFNGGDYFLKFPDGSINVHLVRQHRIKINLQSMTFLSDELLTIKTHVIVCPNGMYKKGQGPPPPSQITE